MGKRAEVVLPSQFPSAHRPLHVFSLSQVPPSPFIRPPIAITTSLPLAIEFFFTSVSIAIETRYQTMPITAMWRKTWKKHILVTTINSAVIAFWLSSRLMMVVVKGLTQLTQERTSARCPSVSESLPCASEQIRLSMGIM